MQHFVTVHQLNTGRGAFMNVDDERGHIAVEFSVYKRPTYMMQGKEGSAIHRVIQFDSEEWEKEYIAAHKDKWDFVDLTVRDA